MEATGNESAIQVLNPDVDTGAVNVLYSQINQPAAHHVFNSLE